MAKNPQYDYDHTSLEGPLAPLVARAANPQFPAMISPPIGWVDLVVALDAAIAEILPGYTIFQVKEKFAGLRYYIATYGVDRTDARVGWVQQMIAKAEARSQTMCQICGAPATVHVEKFVYATLCQEHVDTPHSVDV